MKKAKLWLLIIWLLHIPAGLLFYYGYLNSLVSHKYEVQDDQYATKRQTGNWSERDLQIQQDTEFCSKATRMTFYSFLAFGVLLVVATRMNGYKAVN